MDGRGSEEFQRFSDGRIAAGRKDLDAQQLVASGVHVTADHAGIGDNGAVIVTWESYNATCARYGCSTSAYVLHASRQNAGSRAWIDSGSLVGPDRDAHDARVALDSTGRAILVALTSSGAYVSATQGSSSGTRSSFNTVFNPSGITIISDLSSDDAGQVTLVYEAIIGFSTSQAMAVNGSVSNNTWSSPMVLSGSDSSVGQIFFAVAPGGALAVWLSSGTTPQIHAVTRATATGTWSGPIAISGPGSEIGPEAAAVNSAGNAIVIYSGYDASSVHTEYAVNYHL